MRFLPPPAILFAASALLAALPAQASCPGIYSGTQGPMTMYAVYNGSTGKFDVFGHDDGASGGNDFCCPDIATTGVDRFELLGTEDTDTLSFQYGGSVMANPGSSTFNARIEGHGSDDDITGSPTNNTFYLETLRGDAGDDTITADAGDDSVDGATGADVIDLGAGDDTCNGDEDGDDIIGGDGDDLVFAGTGADAISGGNNRDVLHGDADNDLVCSDSGTLETLTGDAGVDQLWAEDASDTSNCGNQVGDQARNLGTIVGCPGSFLTVKPACP